MLRSSRFELRAFTRPSALLRENGRFESSACLIFDVQLPEMNSVELYAALVASGCQLPVILIIAAADDDTRAITQQIMAVEVLLRAFNRDALLAAIAEASANLSFS